MTTPSSLTAELHQTEQLLMKFPRAIRLQLKVRDLRAQIARQREAKARGLRGQIRRDLMGADVDTLARLARELEAS